MDRDERVRKQQGERLRQARMAAGYGSARAAALENSWPESSYRAHESGTRTIGQNDAERYIQRFRQKGAPATAHFILFGPEGARSALSMPHPVNVVGYAAAGTDTVTFAEAQGPFDEVDAPAWATERTVAVRIRGTSLGRPFNGWLAFYDDRRDPPDESLYGELCICGLTDGRVVIKTLRQGTARGRYHLESLTEPTMIDEPVDWAALVREMRPR